MENTAGPIIFQNQTSDTSSKKTKNSFGVSGSVVSWAIKAIVAVLILIALFQIYRFFTNIQKSPPPVGQLEPVSGGKLALFSDKKAYDVGEIIPVQVKISTGGVNIGGTDLVIKYDPLLLEASGSGVLVTGEVYPEYPVAFADTKKGVISISGISSLNKAGFNGSGVFATLNLKAKKAGTTSLVIDYTPGGTADSNMTRDNSPEDVLEAVYNLDLVVR